MLWRIKWKYEYIIFITCQKKYEKISKIIFKICVCKNQKWITNLLIIKMLIKICKWQKCDYKISESQKWITNMKFYKSKNWLFLLIIFQLK